VDATPSPLEPLYAHRAKDCIGIGVPAGWVTLVLELHERLVEVSPDIRYVQVKQKFGDLRVYVSVTNPAVDALIWAAEERSRNTCDVCGEVGRGCVSDRGWYRALCPTHADTLGYTEASP